MKRRCGFLVASIAVPIHKPNIGSVLAVERRHSIKFKGGVSQVAVLYHVFSDDHIAVLTRYRLVAGS